MSQAVSKFDREHLRILGRRIRSLREAKGWSLKRLSTNSDISVAAIQKIESGAANPSLLTVIAIIEALGESVDQVVSASRKPDKAVNVVRGELPIRGNGDVDLTSRLVDRRMHCCVKILSARQRLKVAEAPSDASSFAYVLDGELHLSFEDGRVDRLSVGDSFHAAADSRVEWMNPLSRKTFVFCVEDRVDKSE